MNTQRTHSAILSILAHTIVIAGLFLIFAGIKQPQVATTPRLPVRLLFQSRAIVPAIKLVPKPVQKHATVKLLSAPLVTKGSTIVRKISEPAPAPERFVKLSDNFESSLTLPSSNQHVVEGTHVITGRFIRDNGTSTGSGGGSPKVVGAGFGAGPQAEVGLGKLQRATVTSPIITYVPQPEYTRSAKEARIQGEVVVRVNLTAQRRVEVLAIVGGLGYGLDQRGIEAARLVRFDPATVNGLPVDFTTNVHITYQLNGAN